MSEEKLFPAWSLPREATGQIALANPLPQKVDRAWAIEGSTGAGHIIDAFGKLMMGTRRHNLVYIDDLAAVPEPDGLRLNFSLPAGSYATVLLEELMKVPVASGEEPDADADES